MPVENLLIFDYSRHHECVQVYKSAYARRTFVFDLFDDPDVFQQSRTTQWFHCIRHLNLNLMIHIDDFVGLFENFYAAHEWGELLRWFWICEDECELEDRPRVRKWKQVWDLVVEMRGLRTLRVFIDCDAWWAPWPTDGLKEAVMLEPLLAVKQPQDVETKFPETKFPWVLDSFRIGMGSVTFRADRDVVW